MTPEDPLRLSRIGPALFLAGTASALLYSLFGPQPPIRGGGEMIALALNLADHGSFSDPFAATIATGPTAVVAPLYPAAAAMIIRLLGRPLAAILLGAGVLLAQGLHAALLPKLSRLFFEDVRPGIYGAVLCIALPVFQFLPAWDAIYTGCGLMLFCLASQSALNRQPRSSSSIVRCSAVAGLLMLLNTTSVVVVLLWIAYELGRRKTTVKAGLQFCLMFGLAAVVFVLPWSLRNYKQLGTFELKDNFGMTLFASNNDCAQASMPRNLASGCYGSHHPAGSITEAQSLSAMGEHRYDRSRTQDALRWIWHHGGAFFHLTALRVIQFWFPDPIGGLYSYSIWIVTIISVPGAYLIFRDRVPVRLFFLSVWLMYPLMYYVVVSDYRYRYPILWLSLLAAGYGISRLCRTGTHPSSHL